MNFSVALTNGRLPGIKAAFADTRAAASAPETTPAGSLDAARDTIVDEILAGDLAASTRATVAKASTPAQAIALLLGSPEFQKR